jgi:hypothetical protein
MGELLVIFAVLLLIAGWYFSLSARYRHRIAKWRRLLTLTALTSLTISIIEMLCGTVFLQGMDFDRRFHLIPRLALVGLSFTLVSLITGGFAHWRAVVCIMPAALIVGFLWCMAVIAL